MLRARAFPSPAFPLAGRNQVSPLGGRGRDSACLQGASAQGASRYPGIPPGREALGAHAYMKQSYLPLADPASRPTTPIACHELPQARFDHVGVHALSDSELLALMLHTGVPGTPILVVASQLVAEAGSVANLATWSVADFVRLKGIGQAKAKQLVAMLELGRRIMQPPAEKPVLNRPELVTQHLKPITHGLAVEKFWVMCLNRKNRLIKLCEVTSGTATSSLAHPREVFREAIRHGATAIVCAHNHPSGDPAPSAADVQVTRQLREAAKAVDIELLDHVIVGTPEADPNTRGFYSFREAGVL